MTAKNSNVALVTQDQSENFKRRNKKVIAEQLRRSSVGTGTNSPARSGNATPTALDFETAAEQVMESVHRRHQVQARAERWRALQVFKQLKKVEETELPLAQLLWFIFGGGLINGGTELIQQNEALYIASEFPRDTFFVQISADGVLP